MQTGGQASPGPDDFGEGGRLGRVGEHALEEQIPDVFEAAFLRQLNRRVFAVVVEALFAAYVADGRFGHHDALESGRDVITRLAGRADPGDAHQVPQRDDPDAAVALDDGQMAVVVRGQAGPCRVRPLVGAEDVGSVRHPEPDGLVVGIGRGGCGPEQVSLGQDADHFP